MAVHGRRITAFLGMGVLPGAGAQYALVLEV